MGFFKNFFIKLTAIFFVSTTLLFLPLTSIAGKKDESGNSEYLYLQTSTYGQIIYNKNEKNYSIILHKIDPWVIYFSNIPDKVTSFQSVADFVDKLSKHLKENKEGLNIGLIAFDEDMKKGIRYTFTILKVKYQDNMKSIMYTAQIIPGPQVSPIPSYSQFKHVALFIDACADCGGGGF